MTTRRPSATRFVLLAASIGVVAAGCARGPQAPRADLILDNARVYTFAWDEPSTTGAPAANAPVKAGVWTPDAQAIAITGSLVSVVGSHAEAFALRGESTRVVDLGGAVVVPGLVDSHTHVKELGEKLGRVDLTGVATEADALARVVAFAARMPGDGWIVGGGWDEGAWAKRYPTWDALNEQFPERPVYLRSLHGFGGWANKAAFAKAGIGESATNPVGGELVRDRRGRLTGIVLNRAVPLLDRAIPTPTDDEAAATVKAGLDVMARDGYVAVHEAGVDAQELRALERLEAAGSLPVRVYAMLSARDPDLCRQWLAKGPERSNGRMLTVRSVKAYYDGALGSRGARLLEDYADAPGHRGVSGEGYQFDRAIVAEMMKAGFQVGIHAIGDAGNRETLDFIEGVLADAPQARDGRHRIEHAQVVSPEDVPRFRALGLIAAMQPPHAVEDMGWAADRLGPERVRHAYAWRTLRRADARLMFSSDLTGSDHNIFYGLHSAMTRRDKGGRPDGGWFPEQRMTPEEAVRGYSTWAAYGARWEHDTGVIATGRWADLSVLSVDPLALGTTDPDRLLDGRTLMTVVSGRVVHESR